MFNKGPRKFSGGERRPHGNSYSPQGRDGDIRARLHPATCSQCGKACEVPFRPNGKKPVYCSDCFGAHRDSPSSEYERSAPRRDSAPTPSYQPQGGGYDYTALKRQMDAINLKVDRILKMVETAHSTPTAFSTADATSLPASEVKTSTQETIRKDLVKKRALKAKRTKK